MSRHPAGSLMSFLAEVPDPRGVMGRRHPLVAMLTHACCAMLRGCRGYAAIAQWGRDQPIEFMHRIGYRRTPASYGSLQAPLSRLDAAALEAALSRWVAHLLGEPAAAGADRDRHAGRGSPEVCGSWLPIMIVNSEGYSWYIRQAYQTKVRNSIQQTGPMGGSQLRKLSPDATSFLLALPRGWSGSPRNHPSSPTSTRGRHFRGTKGDHQECRKAGTRCR